MHTTLDIDNDVLAAAKEVAKLEDKTAGQLISELLREALRARAARGAEKPRNSLGFRTIPAGGRTVTSQLINEMREELNL